MSWFSVVYNNLFFQPLEDLDLWKFDPLAIICPLWNAKNISNFQAPPFPFQYVQYSGFHYSRSDQGLVYEHLAPGLLIVSSMNKMLPIWWFTVQHRHAATQPLVYIHNIYLQKEDYFKNLQESKCMHSHTYI